MDILKEIWYGNIAPCEVPCKNLQYQKLLQELVKLEKDLSEHLTQEQKEQLKQYDDIFNNLTQLNLEEAFSHGFCLGAQIVLAIKES